MIAKQFVKDGSLWRPVTADDVAGTLLVDPVGSLVAITVGTSASTLAALMTTAGASIDASTEFLELKIRDDQAEANVVKLAWSGTVTGTLYDAVMTLDTSRSDPASLLGRIAKAGADAYSLIATASTVVLVRQYKRASS